MKRRTVLTTVLILVLAAGLLAPLALGGGDGQMVLEELSPEEMTPAEPAAEDTGVQPGMIRGKVILDNGEMLPAGIIVESADGDIYRAVTNSLGGYNLRLQPGEYTLLFNKGAEYSTVAMEVTVESYKINYMQDVRLVQLTDLYGRGWIAGDLHQHTHYSDGADSVEEVLYSNISNGLYFGFLTDHNSARGLAEWVQGNRIVADIDDGGQARYFSAFEGVEVTTEFGHYQSLGVELTFDTYEVLLRDIERSYTGEEKDELIREKIIYIAETIKREGGVAQINHPFSSNTMGFNYWEIAHHFDTVEIWNGVFVPGDGRHEPENTSEQGQNYRSKLRWFEHLNEVEPGGGFLAATGGTDNHEVASAYARKGALSRVESMADYQELYSANGRYSGVPTTYVNCRGEINQENILDAIRSGHSFISNGVLLLADVDGATYGDTADAGAGDVAVNLEVFCRDGLEGVHIVKNGQVIHEITLDGTVTDHAETVALTGIAPGDWIVLEGFGVETCYAITNPIFFQ